MSKKILMIVDKLSYDSGVSSVVLNYFTYMDHEKYKIDFLVFEPVDDDIRKFVEQYGSKIIENKGMVVKAVPYSDYSLKEVVGDYDYDIVHCHMPHRSVLYFPLAKKMGVKVRISHSHNSMGSDSKIKAFINWIMRIQGNRETTHFIACSDKAAKFAFGRRKDVTIINNAVDYEKFAMDEDVREQMRREFGIGDEHVFCHIGRFVPQKNQEFLVRAFARVVTDVRNAAERANLPGASNSSGALNSPDTSNSSGVLNSPDTSNSSGVLNLPCTSNSSGNSNIAYKDTSEELVNYGIIEPKLLLIGDGADMEAVKQIVEQLGISDNVIFTGVRKDAARCLLAADSFVLPSRYEGLPVVIVEAQASGLYCLVADTVTKSCNLGGCSFLPLREKEWVAAMKKLATGIEGGTSVTGISDLDVSRIGNGQKRLPFYKEEFDLRKTAKLLGEYYDKCGE